MFTLGHTKLSAQFVFFVILVMPATVFAATVTDFKSLVTAVVDIINMVIYFLIDLSVFIMIWGIFRYLIASGDKERLTKAKDVIVYGLIGIVVMYSIVGIINVLLTTIVFNTSQPTIPKF